MTNSKMVRKNIQLTQTLADRVTHKAKSVGLPFSEYVRHVLVKAIENDTYDYAEILPWEVEKRYNTDLMKFIQQEKKRPWKGAKNGKELIASLADERG
ncbi:MAG: hypothetical protein R3A44_25850 [Caldilineaceae bacterium]